MVTSALLRSARVRPYAITGGRTRARLPLLLETLDQDLALYLFGTPGQDRFWSLWDDLIRGALGAVIRYAMNFTGPPVLA